MLTFNIIFETIATTSLAIGKVAAKRGFRTLGAKFHSKIKNRSKL